jgi:hypothetical protein
VHHRQTASEDENASGRNFVEHATPQRGFLGPTGAGLVKGEPQQHHDEWRQVERVRNELFDDLEGRIRDDGFAAIGRFALKQKIASPKTIWATVIYEIRTEHLVAGGAQRVEDARTVATAWFPQVMRQSNVLQERPGGDWPRHIGVVAALTKRVALDLAGMIEGHHNDLANGPKKRRPHEGERR